VRETSKQETNRLYTLANIVSIDLCPFICQGQPPARLPQGRFPLTMPLRARLTTSQAALFREDRRFADANTQKKGSRRHRLLISSRLLSTRCKTQCRLGRLPARAVLEQQSQTPVAAPQQSLCQLLCRRPPRRYHQSVEVCRLDDMTARSALSLDREDHRVSLAHFRFTLWCRCALSTHAVIDRLLRSMAPD